MNKIKIPKNWKFKYFEVEDNNTKFVYEDQFGIEHIYIDEEPQPELPTYEELQKRLDFMIEQNDKKQQVLDKIKEEVEYWGYEEKYNDDKIFCKCMKKIHELLEEIE